MLEAEIRGIAGQRLIEVLVTNRGANPLTIRVANAYDNAPPPSIDIAASASETIVIDLNESAGWYDVAISLPATPRYLRRFAGRHEDGHAATSDPGPRAILTSQPHRHPPP
ncbi:phospholipase domain-containing protein [Luteibacter sp.]|uniref:phospholipase domain-containing protein n=1 Tax=Luteibacter sp. TaxID=1886636 RepID=UPI002F3E6F06